MTTKNRLMEALQEGSLTERAAYYLRALGRLIANHQRETAFAFFLLMVGLSAGVLLAYCMSLWN